MITINHRHYYYYYQSLRYYRGATGSACVAVVFHPNLSLWDLLPLF